MNRKDWALIVKAIKALPEWSERRGHIRDYVALSFAGTFDKSDGCGSFDRCNFLKACGVTPPE